MKHKIDRHVIGKSLVMLGMSAAGAGGLLYSEKYPGIPMMFFGIALIIAGIIIDALPKAKKEESRQ